MRVLFRGGKFDGRSRDFGPELTPVIALNVGKGETAHYVETGLVEDGAAVYQLSADQRAALPYIVHFIGGPHGGKGRRFAANPADVLVVPTGDGKFTRYKRDPRSPAPGQPLLYEHVETFEGERS